LQPAHVLLGGLGDVVSQVAADILERVAGDHLEDILELHRLGRPLHLPFDPHQLVGEAAGQEVGIGWIETQPLAERGPLRLGILEPADDGRRHLTAGFLATGDLLPVLADTGHADIAYELLLQRTAPSWLYMLDRGTTTVWEDWEGVDDNGTAHDSLNHYSKGAVVRFLHTHTLGLRQDPASIAWESFTIAPLPGGGVSWAKGHLDSPQGRIRVEWRVEGDELVVEADIPAGSRATVVFPDGTTRAAGPGSFSGTAGRAGAR
jgi:alpha-L-rhamnosidase